MKKLYLAAFIFWGILYLGTFFSNNSPWRSDEDVNTFYAAYAMQFKTQDPAVSFYTHEEKPLSLICEQPLVYDYITRPYQLTPRLLTEIPAQTAIDSARYRTLLTLRDNILYQPHPCFHPAYHHLRESDLNNIYTPNDFEIKPTRKLRAQDFKTALIRLADPRLASPVYPNYKSFIIGLDSAQTQIEQRLKIAPDTIIQYAQIEIEGLRVLNDTQLEIISENPYPQIKLWMTLLSFSPIPQECIDFYHQDGLKEKGISMSTYPIGTGPYIMKLYKPDEKIILDINPYYDASLRNTLPRGPSRIHYQLEPELTSEWHKFLQGYYDIFLVGGDLNDQIFNFSSSGEVHLSARMQNLQIQSHKESLPQISYIPFNMMDPVIGGYTDSQKALRQALSIAFNFESYIRLFLNDQAVIGASCLPLNAGIFGACPYPEGLNPVTHQWNAKKKILERHPIEKAKALMKIAGYEGGIDPKTQQPLILYWDHALGGSNDFSAFYQWMRQQAKSIGIDLRERPSDWNRFRDKIDRGEYQMAFMGWRVAYPDPEDLLGLYYSPNSKMLTRGRNLSNYKNEQFDTLFKQIETRENDTLRYQYIQESIRILREDAPAIWAFYPCQTTLFQPWMKSFQPNPLWAGTPQFYDIDTAMRTHLRAQRNAPPRWGIFCFFLSCYLITTLLIFFSERKLRQC